MKKIITLIVISFMTCGILFGQSGIEKIIPDSWKIVKSIEIPSEKLDQFSEKLDGEITYISNDIIKTPTGQIQINIVMLKTDEDVEKAYAKFLELHKTDDKLLKFGKIIYEIRCQDDDLVNEAKELIIKAHAS